MNLTAVSWIASVRSIFPGTPINPARMITRFFHQLRILDKKKWRGAGALSAQRESRHQPQHGIHLVVVFATLKFIECLVQVVEYLRRCPAFRFLLAELFHSRNKIGQLRNLPTPPCRL